MGGKWGKTWGNGVLWGEVGANNKNCGLVWFPHFLPFSPFFLESFYQSNILVQNAQNCDTYWASSTILSPQLCARNFVPTIVWINQLVW